MTKKTLITIILLIMLTITACTAVSEEKHVEVDDDHKNSIEGFIGPEELSEDMSPYTLIDIRPQEEYENEHIEGATNIPLFELSQEKLSEINVNKNSSVIVYGLSSIQATKAQILFKAMDYDKVLVLAGGIVHWKEDAFEVIKGKDTTYKNGTQESVTKISITPAEQDLGIVAREDGIVEVIFTLTNNGEETVSIEEMSTSCGCTSAEIENELIAPNSNTQLTVFFDPNFHQEPMGRFTRSAFLLTSEGVELQAKIWVEIADN